MNEESSMTDESLSATAAVSLTSSSNTSRNGTENEQKHHLDETTVATLGSELVLVTKKAKQLPQHSNDDDRLTKMAAACRVILTCLGEDVHRPGLLKTPERWAQALLDMTAGYSQSPASVVNDALFQESPQQEMVIVRDIHIASLCEHHMVPFTGVVHIGYIPAHGNIIGLSKLARIAKCFAQRLQVQERLTRQIADSLQELLTPQGVAVVLECTHLCMVVRGVTQTAATTVTSAVRGCFEVNPSTRAEFFSIIGKR
jgi:GTP cyclohydrolase IA